MSKVNLLYVPAGLVAIWLTCESWALIPFHLDSLGLFENEIVLSSNSKWCSFLNSFEGPVCKIWLEWWFLPKILQVPKILWVIQYNEGNLVVLLLAAILHSQFLRKPARLCHKYNMHCQEGWQKMFILSCLMFLVLFWRLFLTSSFSTPVYQFPLQLSFLTSNHKSRRSPMHKHWFYKNGNLHKETVKFKMKKID